MQYPHYFKDVSHLSLIDVYRVVELFQVPAGALDHAAKKILCAGSRGAKDQIKDVREAVDALNRWLQMREEDQRTVFMDHASGRDYTATAKVSLDEAGNTVIHDLAFDEARADVIGQNGNDGEHYRVLGQPGALEQKL